jgi:hypothetical protein
VLDGLGGAKAPAFIIASIVVGLLVPAVYMGSAVC